MLNYLFIISHPPKKALINHSHLELGLGKNIYPVVNFFLIKINAPSALKPYYVAELCQHCV